MQAWKGHNPLLKKVTIYWFQLLGNLPVFFLNTFTETQQSFCHAVSIEKIGGKRQHRNLWKSETHTPIFESNYDQLLWIRNQKVSLLKHILRDSASKVLKASMRSLGKVYVSTEKKIYEQLQFHLVHPKDTTAYSVPGTVLGILFTLYKNPVKHSLC